MKLYVNWDLQEILTVSEYAEMVEQEIIDAKEGRSPSSLGFTEFLDSNFSSEELFKMKESVKREVERDYMESVTNDVMQIVEHDWEEVEIEVEPKIVSAHIKVSVKNILVED